MFLHELLRNHQATGITLSNLKRMFRLHFERELSETALGHVRLLDLMKDSRLSDICALSVEENGQTMVHLAELAAFQNCAVMSPCVWSFPVQVCAVPLTLVPYHVEQLPESLDSPGSSPRGSSCGRQSFCSETTLTGPPDSSSVSDDCDTSSCISCCDSDRTPAAAENWSVCVKNTFIDVIQASSPSSRQRCRSTPATWRHSELN